MRLWEISEPATKLVIMNGDETSRLVRDHKINHDAPKRLKYFNNYQNETQFMVLKGNMILAAGGLEKNPRDESIWWIKHVSVDTNYQSQGFARQIFEAMFKYAIKHHIKLQPSAFTKMGQDRLLHIYNDLRSKYPQAVISGKEGDPRMFEKKLNELWNQPADWTWIERDPKEWEASFKINDVRYRVFLIGQDGRSVSLSFATGDNREDITGDGNAFQVFATLKAILDDFLRHRKPKSISFSANESSRIKLYHRMANQLAQAVGGKVELFRSWPGRGFQVTLDEKEDDSGMFEALDRAVDWQWVRKNSGEWIAKFQSSKQNYWVYLDGEDNKQVLLTFTDGQNSEEITGSGDPFTVFAAVSDIVRDFLKHRQPKSLYFVAKGRGRQKLYKRLAQKLSNELGKHDAVELGQLDDTQQMFYRIKLKEDGKVVSGVNTTCDVQPGETQRQAIKFGNALDSQGRPPLLQGSYGDDTARYSANQGDPFYGPDGTILTPERK